MHRLFGFTALLLPWISAASIAQPPTPIGMSYASDHWRQSLELYLPERGCAPFPLAIFIHGGGWLTGDSSQALPFVEPLIERGFAVAAINYRWSGQAIFPAQIHDCKGAVRFLRANAGTFQLDPSKFGVVGDSAGGHLAALLGTTGDAPSMEGNVGGNLEYSSRPLAVADLAGPTDLFAYGAIHNSPDSTVSQLFGWPIQDIIDHKNDPDYASLVALVNSANPITHITPNEPPFHIVHGDADDNVPLSQSQILHNALVNSSNASELVVIPGGPHLIAFEDYLPAFDALAKAMDVHPFRFADLDCDGSVNVNDLLGVINAWGPCPAPCAADVNADSAVNVNDMLAVINDWG